MGKFEKEDYREEFFQAVHEELKMIIENGEIRKELREYVKCPLCGQDKSKEIFRKQGFRFVECGCGLVYVNPQVNKEKITDYYKNGKSIDLWMDVLTSKPEMENNTRKFNEELDIIEKIKPSKGKMLEVGCSIGLLLKLAEERGWEAIGLELNGRASEYARKEYGLNILEKKIEDCGFENETFDVIAMYGILEHLKNPKEILELSSKLLKKDGLLTLLVPNLEGFDVRILQEKASIFTGRNHLQYFSIKTLGKMLEMAGFKIAKYKTSVSCIDPVLNYINGKEPYTTDTDISVTQETRERLDKLILEKDMGHYIHACAKKL